MSRPIRVGTRGSRLALAQAEIVAQALRSAGTEVEIVVVKTAGDGSAAPVPEIGVGVFTSALRDALAAGEVDVAVHSYKDLPTAPDPRLMLAAVPPREDPRDALVARDRLVLGALPVGATVGTGSPRRRAQLNALGLGLVVTSMRGNVDTRIAAVRAGELDAVVVARAGLARLGRLDEASEVLDPLQMLPAPAQGALAVECRAPEHDDDVEVEHLLRTTLDHDPSRVAVAAERAVLAALEAGCTVPVGALADLVSDLDDDGHAVDRILLRAVLGMASGVVRASVTGETDQAEKLGQALAAELLDLGGVPTEESGHPAQPWDEGFR